MQGEETLSVVQLTNAAKLLNVSPPTISRWVRNGELKARYRRHGKKKYIFIPLEELREKYPDIEIPESLIQRETFPNDRSSQEYEQKQQKGFATEDIRKAIKDTEQGLARLKKLIETKMESEDQSGENQ